ncbi:hypothetical protein PQX77_011915 [Marasmius sp. AFHP31]|nr:hypothetical protein PQX77_011915 [Marasmius sp. AFHP31]
MSITQGTSSTTMTVHVDGDQINHIVQQRVKEHTEFDDVSLVVPATKHLAVSPESELTTSTDHVVNERTGAEYGGEFEGVERCEQHLDQALLERCTALSTLTAERPSLPSISETDPFPDSTSLNVVLPRPYSLTPPISTHTDPNVSSIGSDTIVSMSDSPKNAGLSAISQFTHNNNLNDALASSTVSVVSYSPNPSTHTPVHSTSSIEPVNELEYVPPQDYHRDGEAPTWAPQQYWIPRPFTSNIRPIISPIINHSLRPVPATRRPPTRSEDNCCDDDGIDDLD